MIGGFIFQQIDPYPLSTVHRFAMTAETAGWSGLIVGIPLLFVPLRMFWLDIAYIVIGLMTYQYMMTFIDGSYIFLGLVPIAAMGMVLTGASCLVRRSLAYRSARRRAQK